VIQGLVASLSDTKLKGMFHRDGGAFLFDKKLKGTFHWSNVTNGQITIV